MASGSDPIMVPLHPHLAANENPQQAGYTEEQDAAEQPETMTEQAAWETGTHHNDYDPGMIQNFPPSGMPDITQAELQQMYEHAQQALAQQFEAAHPGYSYTRGKPIDHVGVVQQKASRTPRVRAIVLSGISPAPLVLARNPQRDSAYISTAATTVVISDDPAALEGMAANYQGNGFLLPPNTLVPWSTEGELFAQITSGAIVTISVLEFINN